MDFFSYKSAFDTLMGVKSVPNEHEKILNARAETYIAKITWIPGLRMVAVVNSLSMNATTLDSDIDLFIITAKHRIWLVRVLTTLTFWLHGVWRQGDDIAGNFCLSFFIEETAMDFSRIAIEDDVYLYFWTYCMRPIYIVGDTYDRLQQMNPEYRFQSTELSRESPKTEIFCFFWYALDACLRWCLLGKTLRNYEKKGRPEGVVIASDILKFHDRDKRSEIRDQLLER